MKYVFTYLLLLVGLVSASASPIYAWESVNRSQMQSQRIMRSGVAYSGTVYTPFDNTSPSEYHPVAAGQDQDASGGRHGHIRKEKILGPDTPPANQYPIGEPWILALFAAIMAAVIAIKHQIKQRQQTAKNIMTMQNNNIKSEGMWNVCKRYVLRMFYVFMILFTIGIGQMWGTNYYISGASGLTGHDWWCMDDAQKFVNNELTFTGVSSGSYQFKLSGYDGGDCWYIGGHSNFASAYGTASKTSGDKWDNAQVTLSVESDVHFYIYDDNGKKVSAVGVPTTCYITGNGTASNPWCDSKNWTVDGSVMTKNSDGTHTKTFQNVPAGTYKFKVTNGSWTYTLGDGAFDAGGSNISKDETDNDKNIVFTTSYYADITITLDGYKVYVNVEYVQLRIYRATPEDAANAVTWNWDSYTSNIYTKTLSLNVNTVYEFKVYEAGTYYGCNSGFTGTTSNRQFYSNQGDCSLTTKSAGNFILRWNRSNHQMTVTYPPSIAATCASSIYSGSNATITATASQLGSGTHSVTFDFYKGTTLTDAYKVATQTFASVSATSKEITQSVTPSFNGTDPGSTTKSQLYTVKMTCDGNSFTNTVYVYRKWDIYIHDVASWNAMYVYLYNSNTDYNTAWPGANFSTNYYNSDVTHTWYTVTLDGKYSKFILDNNAGNKQTNKDGLSTNIGTYTPGSYWYTSGGSTEGGKTYYGLTSTTISTPTVTISATITSATQVNLTGTITNNGGDGSFASDMQEVYFNVNNVKTAPTSTSTTGGTFTKSLSNPTADETNNTLSAHATNILYTGNSSSVRFTNVTLDKQDGSSGTSSIVAVNGFNMASGATAPSRTGYIFGGYYASSGGSGKQYYNASMGSANTWDQTSNTKTIYAKWTANTYYVSFSKNGGSGDDMSNQTFTYDVADNLSTNTYTRTGYTFDGWATSAGGTVAYADKEEVENLTTTNGATYPLFAHWTANPYTVTLDVDEANKGNIASATTSQDVTYDGATTTVPNRPTAAQGYALYGYYTGHNGTGTKVINADGTWIASVTGYTDGSRRWVHDGDVTLYAYYKNAEITAITLNQSIFEPVAAGGSSYVTANPTIEPTPTGNTKICWALLYDDENPVTGDYKAEAYTEGGAKPNQVRFNLAGLAAGSYRIRATLYTGTTCSGDTLLSTYDKSVTIATDFQVTVKYMCGTEEIKASEIVDGHATTETTISAPDIFGYTFSTWNLGDGGITTEMALTTKDNFEFKATYNGILTAKYTKNKYIYLDLSGTFSESGKWDNPYCYIYDSNTSWNNDKGTGATGTMHCIAKGAMTQITGTDIWYYDYSSYTASFANKVAFTWGDKTSQEYFYSVDVIYRADFSEGTPLFIPAVGQNKEVKNSSGKYYNRGYWTNYIGSKTGYTLRIYNKDDVLIKEILFRSTSNDMRMTMKATVDLEAATIYKVEILRDNGHYYKNNDARNYGNSQNNWEYREDLSKGNLLTTAAGDYTFTLSYTDYSNDKNYQIRMIVDYPANEGDFQVLYGDRDTWSLNSAHSATWRHPSRMITARAGGVDTISFFVPKEKDPASLLPTLYARKVNSVNASTGAITWDAINIGASASQSLSVDSSAVYNFKVTQSAAGTISSIENIGAYTGEYYIRCDAMNSKWDNYTTDDDHRMTYSSFSESSANAFGEKYSHYKAKWCKYGKNVKFVIANDYSPCISDTLVQDVPNTYNNINEDGFLKDDGTAEETENIYSANIRFMWNRKTNKISRAYVASSTNASRLFLVLRGNTAIKGLDDSPIEDEGSSIPSVILQDDQNWIYEEVLYIKPNTRFKLYACYAQVTASPNGAQYFRGSYNGNAFSGDPGVDSENSVVLIGGSGETYQKARVLYDFKTNRLICAWLPSSSAIDEEIGINADVMVIREHHEPAQYISFKDEDSKLTGVKTVYGVMKFNRWILNNRQQTGSHEPLAVGDQKSIYERSLYFVSFPFDVRVGDIFGFGRYWDEWYIEYYDGLNRAKNGYWIDSPPNWKYVTPEMATNYVLKANEGYILGLDLDFMAYDNTTFWAHDIETIELFFPSTTSQETLQQVNCTIPALSAIEGDPYRCRINRDNGEGDRRVKDSYWRCLGVPSFNIYNTSLKDASGEAITWQPSGNTLPFIYMWNKGDNTLTAQSTSTFTFLPMHSYLVQNGGEIRWTNVSAKPVSPIVARRTNDMPETEYEWRLALMSDSNLIDQTFVRMTNLEQVTDSFDFGQDLSKEFNTARSNIYSYIGYERAAANSMTLKTETTTVIPLGLNIIAAGEYTLAMPDGTHGVGVTLVDTQTNERTNLSAGMAQTVTLAQGDYLNRFFLEISPIHNAPTGIEEVTGNGLPTTEARKVLIDGILYIVKDGQLFDATGKRVE